MARRAPRPPAVPPKVGDVVVVDGFHGNYRPRLVRVLRDEDTGRRYGALVTFGANEDEVDGCTTVRFERLRVAPPRKRTAKKRGRVSEDPA